MATGADERAPKTTLKAGGVTEENGLQSEVFVRLCGSLVKQGYRQMRGVRVGVKPASSLKTSNPHTAASVSTLNKGRRQGCQRSETRRPDASVDISRHWSIIVPDPVAWPVLRAHPKHAAFRSTATCSTSSGSRFHQFSSEKISTSLGP